MPPLVRLLAAACAAAALPTGTARAAPGDGEARVIVKFREGSSLLVERASAVARESAQAVAARHDEQARRLGVRVGAALRAGAVIAERTQVVRAPGGKSGELAARIAALPEVEYAVPDRLRRRAAVPDDPLFLAGGANGPAVGQWYLRAPDAGAPAAIDAQGAWDLSTGDPSVVVAVLDSGVRRDHADLGANLLAGYDMIGDVAVANDGNGRDADPSDPGDWITQAESDAGGQFNGCMVEGSSWHGTQVASLVAALTDNGLGMASVGRRVKVLPVRVLGKCGGFDSDIIAGMRWAAGLHVDGVPDNPAPAQVLNLSLGGEGACSSAYADAVSAIAAAGASIVASAGNEAGHAVDTPANCAGVIAVVGVRHVGTKVGFSNLGPEVTIAAPGGNCVNASGACLYPIITATNAGTTTPVAAGSIYTDGLDAAVGTSFSAPLVAGTAALMLSVQPSLSPGDIRAALQRTARAFPTTGGDNGDGTPVPQCTAPQFDAVSRPVDQLQCYCTTATCGAGLLDASAAVLDALGVRARIDVAPAAPLAGQSIALSAAGSLLAAGRQIAAVAWTLIDGGGIVAGFNGATDGTTAFVTASGPGRFTVQASVTDSAGGHSTATLVVDVQPAASSSGGGGGGGGGALAWGWLLALAGAVALAARRR